MHRRISDEGSPPCPSCQGGQVKKRISQTAFQLKGGGWYKDGYAKAAGSSKTSNTPASGDVPASKGATEKTTATPATNSKSSADAPSTHTSKDAVKS